MSEESEQYSMEAGRARGRQWRALHPNTANWKNIMREQKRITGLSDFARLPEAVRREYLLGFVLGAGG